MQDYYIRTPDHEESRGPFNISKLLTLGEAGQINENTLYYDEDKEEWMPIALNEELKAQVFPERKQLELKVAEVETTKKKKAAKEAQPEKIEVEELLAAAEGTTEDTKHLKEKEKSFEKAASVASSGIGLMLLLSAVALIMPHFDIVDRVIKEEAYATVANYPFLIIGLFDLVMAIFLFLAVTEVYPLLRARGMLTLGFGLYVGWALNDPILMGCCALGGLGLFWATIAQSYATMLSALLFGVLGHGYLTYQALNDRFAGFFDAVSFKFFNIN